MQPHLNRAERSALHAASITALNVPAAYSEDAETYRRQVWCEVMCWAEPENVFRLADEVEAQLPSDYVEIETQSLNDLRAREGELEINLALKLIGFRCRERGRVKTVWTNAPIGSSGQKLALEL